MRGLKSIGLFLMLLSVTACAPVVYDANYRSSTRHTSVAVYQNVHPIEVTLYADNTYLGVYFQPVHLIIADNQYVEIPVRDRRGRPSKVFAHYHQNNLHFDSDRQCRNIIDSSRYSYDNSWDMGRNYSHINAGKDHDLAGLRLKVRSLPDERREKEAKAVDKGGKTLPDRRKQVVNTLEKQTVKEINKTIKKNVTVLHEEKMSLGQHVEKPSNNREAKKVVENRGANRAVKAEILPEIVKKVNKNKELQVTNKKTAQPVNKKQVAKLKTHTEIPVDLNQENGSSRRQNLKGKNDINLDEVETPGANGQLDAKQPLNKYSQDNKEGSTGSTNGQGKSDRKMRRND